MKKALSIIISLVLLVMSVAILPITSASAATAWPSVSTSRTIAFIATKNFPVFRDTALKTRGTVSPNEAYGSAEVWEGDDCYVIKIVNDNVLLIDYPTSGGRVRKRAYCARTNVFPSLPKGFKAATGANTFTKPNGSRYGSIDKDDSCYLMGIRSGTYSYGIVYPIASNKWKFGWVTKAAYQDLIRKPEPTQTKYLQGIENWKQYDSRWKNTMITTRTIGDRGCLITCMAMAEGYRLGRSIRPDTMRNSLSFDGNMMYWPSNYYALASGKGTESLKKVYNVIKSGRPVIVGADSSTSSHWVLIYGYKNLNPDAPNASNFLINDPNSTSRTTLQAFLNDYSSDVLFKTYR